MKDSTPSSPGGKQASRRKPAKLKKPKGFPLSIHQGSGYWCKKVDGHVYYFGRVADDLKGKEALKRWLDEKDDLLAGRTPKAREPDAITVADLSNHFLTHHARRRDDGAISPRTFLCLHTTCANMVHKDALGKKQAVSDLGPDDFDRLRQHLAKTRQAVALGNEMTRCRSVFKYAFKNGLIDRPVRYGSQFDKPPQKQLRRNKREHQQEHGARMLEAADIRKILAACNPQMRAMVLLGVNAALGQSDLSALPKSALDLDAAMLDYPRPKTEADRLCPLWSETVAALRLAIDARPKPKDPADDNLVFVTSRGSRFVKFSTGGLPTDVLGASFTNLLKKLGLKRRGLSFYCLRHSFRTVADAVLDDTAVNLIMGHCDSSMAAHYRERVGKDRLQKVTEHVRAWLFAEEEEAIG